MYRSTKRQKQTIEQRARDKNDSNYPQDLPLRRKRIIIEDYDFGYVKKEMILLRTSRVDCYKVVVNGKVWKEKIGLSNILAAIRKSFPRVLSERNL